MKKNIVISIIAVLFLLNVLQFSWDFFAYRSMPDAVPDEETARAIGAVMFGEKTDPDSLIVTYLPKKKAWHIYEPVPEGYVGGDYLIVIRQRDAKPIYRYNGM